MHTKFAIISLHAFTLHDASVIIFLVLAATSFTWSVGLVAALRLTSSLMQSPPRKAPVVSVYGSLQLSLSYGVANRDLLLEGGEGGLQIIQSPRCQVVVAAKYYR